MPASNIVTDPKRLENSIRTDTKVFVDFASVNSIYSGSTACVTLVFPDKYLVAMSVIVALF